MGLFGPSDEQKKRMSDQDIKIKELENTLKQLRDKKNIKPNLQQGGKIKKSGSKLKSNKKINKKKTSKK